MEAVWTPCRDLNSDHRLRRSISYSVRRQGDFSKKELAYVALVRRANVILEKMLSGLTTQHHYTLVANFCKLLAN